MPRTFSASYKRKILAEIDAATARGERGGVGRILRREGLYSSLITTWRRQRAKGTLDSNGHRRDATRDTLTEEVKRLRKQNARLEARLATAEELTQAQGKAFALLQRMSRESDDAT